MMQRVFIDDLDPSAQRARRAREEESMKIGIVNPLFVGRAWGVIPHSRPLRSNSAHAATTCARPDAVNVT